MVVHSQPTWGWYNGLNLDLESPPTVANASLVETAVPTAKWASMCAGTLNAARTLCAPAAWAAEFAALFVLVGFSSLRTKTKKVELITIQF